MELEMQGSQDLANAIICLIYDDFLGTFHTHTHYKKKLPSATITPGLGCLVFKPERVYSINLIYFLKIQINLYNIIWEVTLISVAFTLTPVMDNIGNNIG